MVAVQQSVEMMMVFKLCKVFHSYVVSILKYTVKSVLNT